MKHEVFILGQTIDQKQEGMVERLGEMRGRRERIEKGSREGIEKRQKDKGPERPLFIGISRSDPAM